jgi:MOSC domain-containing protein YiiM
MKRVPDGFIQQINISNGGIPKRSIAEGVVTELGIEGDVQAHPQFHGGPRQAILLISHEGIEELTATGFPLYPGALGENVTTQGLDRRSWRVGQRYRLGTVTIELTKLREPCNALNHYGRGIQKAVFDSAIDKGNPESPRWGLSGFYARVIETGVIRTGDPITLVR